MNGYIRSIKEKLNKNFDVNYRILEVHNKSIYIIFIDNMCDSKFISDYIVSPIAKNNLDDITVDNIKSKILEGNSVGDINDINEALMHILSGDVLITIDGYSEAIYCEAKGFSKRGISYPMTEEVIKGPREGFDESFNDNISLIRKRIKNPDLKFENFYIGKESNTVVVMSYIEHIAKKELVDKIRKKLKGIDIDFVLESNYIEEQFQEKRSLFDTVETTEKPDVVASKILEGRIAIIVDGTPFVITVPHFFIENFNMADDYYVNKYYSSIARMLRYVAFMISVFLPGLYIAITTYHFSLIPSVFVFRLAVSRAGVPFPQIVELYLMMLFFQILREAGLRLPNPVGQAMSIVGALILGDAAVGAGLTSQTGVIIVALSSICSFLVPKLYSVVTVWGIFIVLISSLLGLPGFYVGMLSLFSHAASLNSVGYPYLYPLGTIKEFKSRDTLLREDLKRISKSIYEDDKNEEKNY
ncbi:spore germination protein [Clostridium rectalis]|uniref:spore germination protein n=1 Tax=Clostridium rectalis TaxID=2040295 RepID=UPI000F644819|nr:spore germination protein [Clostridium rectalis]